MLSVRKSDIAHSNRFLKTWEYQSLIVTEGIEKESQKWKFFLCSILRQLNMDTMGNVIKNYINSLEPQKIKFFNRPSTEHV